VTNARIFPYSTEILGALPQPARLGILALPENCRAGPSREPLRRSKATPLSPANAKTSNPASPSQGTYSTYEHPQEQSRHRHRSLPRVIGRSIAEVFVREAPKWSSADASWKPLEPVAKELARRQSPASRQIRRYRSPGRPTTTREFGKIDILVTTPPPTSRKARASKWTKDSSTRWSRSTSRVPSAS